MIYVGAERFQRPVKSGFDHRMLADTIASLFSRNVTHLMNGVARIAVEDHFTRPQQTPREQRLDEIHTLVSRASMHLPKGQDDFAVGLRRQFSTMLSAEAWEDLDELPSVEALETFLRVLLSTGAKSRPGLGTNGRGSVTAFWRRGENRLTVDCLPTGSVRWVLSRLNDKGELERAAAECQPDRLIEVLSAFKPEVWFA